MNEDEKVFYSGPMVPFQSARKVSSHLVRAKVYPLEYPEKVPKTYWKDIFDKFNEIDEDNFRFHGKQRPLSLSFEKRELHSYNDTLFWLSFTLKFHET